MEPQPTRYLRLVETEKGEPGALWSIAELFVYEAATTPCGASARRRRGRDRRGAPPEPLDGRPRGAQSGPRPRHVRAPAGAGPLARGVRRGEPRPRARAGVGRRAPPLRSGPRARGLVGRASISTSSGPRRIRRGRRSSAGPRQADALPEGLWRRGRMERWAEALDRLGQGDAAAAVRLRSAPAPVLPTKIRFGDALDLVGVDLPREVRPGETVTVRYHWRLAQPLRQDYWAFLHVRGLKDARNQDQPIGAGTSAPRSGPPERRSGRA